jgi:hypothetical protein
LIFFGTVSISDVAVRRVDRERKVELVKFQ